MIERATRQAVEQARVSGKYRQLLRRIEVKADIGAYGEFTDYGYWVYVYPYWYIWGKQAV